MHIPTNTYRDLLDHAADIRRHLKRTTAELRQAFNCQVKLQKADRLLRDVRQIIVVANALADFFAAARTNSATDRAKCSVLMIPPPAPVPTGISDPPQRTWFDNLRTCAAILRNIVRSLRALIQTIPTAANWRELEDGLRGVRHAALDVETQIERSLALLPASANRSLCEVGLVAAPFEDLMAAMEQCEGDLPQLLEG